MRLGEESRTQLEKSDELELCQEDHRSTLEGTARSSASMLSDFLHLRRINAVIQRTTPPTSANCGSQWVSNHAASAERYISLVGL